MKRFDHLRIGLTVIITLAIWSLLLWQHYHGGVAAHHLLHDPDLPKVSDWFGGFLLPALAWGLLGLAKRRVRAGSGTLRPVIIGLLAGSVYGASMATTFSIGQEAITSYLFYGLLPLALFLPVYRPECLLGFVLGMCTVFGTVLPTLFGSLMALATYLVHRLLGLPLMRALSVAGTLPMGLIARCRAGGERHENTDPAAGTGQPRPDP